MLYVSSLSRLKETVERTGATRMVSLINAGTPVERPQAIAADNHLFLGFNDIVDPVEGLVPPGEVHVSSLLGFVQDWDKSAPLVIHCWAGISRSTAGAFITACALTPDADEAELASVLRARAPSATPNARLVAIADRMLARDGRMIEAIRAIGRGADAFEGTPFEMPLA
ncbi:tyrosine phosphatase family protein [Pannonibacter phragmitetus]|uniref:Tyrosine protein phosphatase n=1 Tax=Pannonibacter phragmitetus TaxID=121719 RepID=A0A0U3EIA2_9HYPH|nr:tyrosine phosphatase family protein [Pannonibacter phragmitetus]ALV25791.1 tyrosine protein phosphatase [Pannonibacter phragmitetus]MBA4206528.1 thiosulfate sulfurtransferase GlpE [Polymorphum sp.]